MQGKGTVVVVSSALVIGLGLLGWQSWNTQQLQQQVVELQQIVELQQQVPAQDPAHGAQQGGSSLTQRGGQTTPTTPPPVAGAPINPQLLSPNQLPPSSQIAPQLSGPGADPLWGGQDPFAEMQQMQQQMHQHMQELMSGFGMGTSGSSLFDMDPFQGGPGFGSSMGFGDEPQFDFSENGDNYQVSISIPQGSNVEINTSTQGSNLTIEGKVTVEQNNQSNGSAFSSKQTRQFARTLQLPDDVDPLGLINETQGDHVVITLPKKKTAQL